MNTIQLTLTFKTNFKLVSQYLEIFGELSTLTPMHANNMCMSEMICRHTRL